ncbi:MAG: hypothetical protein KME32_32425 [Mojavia pulchra JT2-VF2]|jgi:hypothetical protein|uniref:Uncharacterized protein n=1 Tax=Mojavia pulchra JT2-VF2 TaxID=287848 RepID=A0A951Q6T8_9NOST|nr:hypothetical protein [Mojavia pulchra JT2-VF2]
MIHEIEFGKLVVILDRQYSLSEFRTASQVIPGSYAEELVERVYNCLFKHSKNLVTEYEKYYAVEYAGFCDFLYWKYKFSKDIAMKIQSRMENSVYVAHTRDSIWMFKDETVSSVLKHILYQLGESDCNLEEETDYELEESEWEQEEI